MSCDTWCDKPGKMVSVREMRETPFSSLGELSFKHGTNMVFQKFQADGGWGLRLHQINHLKLGNLG